MIREGVLVALMAGGAFGCCFLLAAAAVVRSTARRAPARNGAVPAVTILKPLYGDEPGLFENLASFCEQDYGGSVQIVFGLASPHDPAAAVAGRLRAAYPDAAIELVIDGRVAGSNPKVANLINMAPRIAHEIIVLADSDIRVQPDYLSRVVTALERFGGVVTCPYYGISTGSIWSRLSLMMIDGHFLPSVMIGSRLKLSKPCLGSTIALTRRSLAAIGSFEAVADCLADDHEIGARAARRGEPVTLLPFAVGHVCDERSLAELWRHEVRWALTIRSIDPLGYLGWILTHPLPLALIALALGGGWPAAALVFAALGGRALLLLVVERGYGLPKHPIWLIPVRDLLSFAVFLAGFAARGVSWRGQRLRLMSQGTLRSEKRSPSP